MSNATQSSTSSGGSASRAIDGNTSQQWYGGSCTHTGYDSPSWWKADFDGEYTVTSVTLYNRSDCCGERLSEFTINIGGTECTTYNDGQQSTYTVT